MKEQRGKLDIQELIRNLKRLHAAADPEPWIWKDDPGRLIAPRGDGEEDPVLSAECIDDEGQLVDSDVLCYAKNAELIAYLRNNAKVIIEALERSS